MSITRYHIELDDKTVSMRIEGSLEDRLRGWSWRDGGLAMPATKLPIESSCNPALRPGVIFIHGVEKQGDNRIAILVYDTHEEALAYYNKVVATLEAWSKYCEELKG